MFDHVGWGELLVLALVALFVFGPERLPQVAADAGRMLRSLRSLAQNATADLKAELGPEMADLDLASLHPRTFVAKNLFGDDEQTTPTAVGRPTGEAPLAAGERPPYDPDAT
ncbi:MAG: sec-independent translocase [Mycobacteriales bacterium]